MDETDDSILQDKEETYSPPDRNGPEHAKPRKRTRRACDKCSSSRTRCDGECPCRRCQDYGYSCRYNRQVKKRGRLPSALAASLQTKTKSWDAANEDGGEGAPRDTENNGNLPSLPSLMSPDVARSFPRSPFSMKLAEDGLILNHPNGSERSSLSRPMAVNSADATAGSFNTNPDHRRYSGSKADYYSTRQYAPSVAGGYGSESAVMPSDESIAQTSPDNFAASNALGESPREPDLGGVGGYNRRYRGSFSTSATAPDQVSSDAQRVPYLLNPPHPECRYKFLDPVLPFVRNIMPASVACDLLDVFLTDPGSSLFRCASPYILTRIFRKKSILHPTHPRRTSPALLAAILWCAAKTADIMALHVPSSRAKVVNDLYDLVMLLVSERDPDRWRRTHGGLRAENEESHIHGSVPHVTPATTATNEPAGVVDDVLTYTLLLITVSGGDFKSDCRKWWSKAVRLAMSLKLNREDEPCSEYGLPCVNPLCACKRESEQSPSSNEAKEERRRVFWLLFSLDRHLALSFNAVLTIPDACCEVYTPLPESVWENLDSISVHELPARVLGPPTLVTGTGFFEYFLPLMTILGDIIEVHHRRQHPRLGGLEDSNSVAVISELLAACEQSLERLAEIGHIPLAGVSDHPREQLVTAYGTHIIHVLHVLLHGQWDAISMLDDSNDWITSQRFHDCASHAIAASQAVSNILKYDPELTFMPYLFGIYLLHGSFILLLFADRMPQLGPNQSVEQACETIIRAHEVCVVTLSTEFQKYFRKVLRSTLYSVRGSGSAEREEKKARRRALSLYRWTKGGRGLGL